MINFKPLDSNKQRVGNPTLYYVNLIVKAKITN